MQPHSGNLDRRRELLLAWERRSRARGDTAHCNGADALFLVTAVSNALRRASETPELGRAARTWGARFSSPVDALASLSMLREALTGLAEGASDGLPVPLAVLHRVFDQATLEAVDAASANLRSAARNDPLTGCANRRALEEDLAHAAASARRSNLDLAVAVIDLDGLKQINDTLGHGAGDAALVDLVATLRQALREADTLYRTGGDEFVVVAPFTDAAGARALMRRAERLRGPSFSWGVASLAGLAATAADTVAAAGTAALADAAIGAVRDPATLMDAADTDLYERRRRVRRAAVVALRKRRATVVASAAASVVVTASMAGLAVALDSGGASPAGGTVSAGRASSGTPSGWPSSALRAPSPRHVGGFHSADGPGQPGAAGGTSLVGLLGTVVPPSVLLPSGPALLGPLTLGPTSVNSGVTAVQAILPTLIVPVTTSQPIALVSVGSTSTPVPVTAAAPQNGNGSGAGGGSTDHPSGGHSGAGQGAGPQPATDTTSSHGGGPGRGAQEMPAGHGKG